ncbi:MAG: hypothetical protein STSR0007_04100 [Thermovirga sp.]
MHPENCYVLQIFEIVECSRGGGGDVRDVSGFLPSQHKLNPGMQAFLEKGKTCVDWDLFICRSFEKAKELMLDGDFLNVDWFSCYEEDDNIETGLAVYKSTDNRYIGRIFRTEIF